MFRYVVAAFFSAVMLIGCIRVSERRSVNSTTDGSVSPIGDAGISDSYMEVDLSGMVVDPWSGTHDNTAQVAMNIQLKPWSSSEQALPENAGSDTYLDMDSTVLYLHLNGTLGSISDGTSRFPDSSGMEQTAVARNTNGTGLSFVDGIMDEAVSFDGIDDSIEVTNSTALSLNVSDWTIAGWIWVEDSSNLGILLDHSDGLGTSGWRIAVDSAYNRLELAADDTTVTSFIGSIQPQRWYHIAASVEESKARLLIDGIPVTEPQTLSSISPLDTLLRIGVDFSGRLDELAIWQRALSDTELREIYMRQAGPFGGGRNGTYTSAPLQIDTIDTGPLTLTWEPYAPAGKPLPDNGVSETAYASGNVSMQDIAGLWHFDGQTAAVADGSTFPDTSGNETTAQSSNSDGIGMQLETGRFGQALCLDGVDDYVSLPSTLTAATTDFTFAAWVLWRGELVTDAGDDEYQRIFDFGSNTANADSGAYVFFTPNSDSWSGNGTFTFSASLSGYSHSETVSAAHALPRNRWMHVAVSQQAATVSLYVNGVQVVTSDAANINLSDVIPLEHWLGRSHYNEDSNFYGCLDEVAFWRRALDGETIAAMYERGAVGVGVQLRLCDSPSECESATFVGPDGSATSYFDNTTNFTPELPSLSISESERTSYLQYRLLFSTDDTRHTARIRQVRIGPARP